MKLTEILGVAAAVVVVVGGAVGATYVLKRDGNKAQQTQALEIERLKLQQALAAAGGNAQAKAPTVTGVKPLDGLINGFNQLGGVNGVRNIVTGIGSLIGK